MDASEVLAAFDADAATGVATTGCMAADASVAAAAVVTVAAVCAAAVPVDWPMDDWVSEVLPVAPGFADELVTRFGEKPALCAAPAAVLCEKVGRRSADGALPVPADGALPPVVCAGRESPS
ncbi:hypothetical protein [Nocardia sp. NPDC052112]|uniref:hypothetical protein n=1 Tax=Nocardia sp. NPDC052112 TaxID=3155646 RepID=UPI003421DC5D